MIKLEFSSKILEIWKMYILRLALDSFLVLQNFSDKISSDVNKYDF